MQTDLAYKVGWEFGEAFDRYLNDNTGALTSARVWFSKHSKHTVSYSILIIHIENFVIISRHANGFTCGMGRWGTTPHLLL